MTSTPPQPSRRFSLTKPFNELTNLLRSKHPSPFPTINSERKLKDGRRISTPIILGSGGDGGRRRNSVEPSSPTSASTSVGLGWPFNLSQIPPPTTTISPPQRRRSSFFDSLQRKRPILVETCPTPQTKGRGKKRTTPLLNDSPESRRVSYEVQGAGRFEDESSEEEELEEELEEEEEEELEELESSYEEGENDHSLAWRKERGQSLSSIDPDRYSYYQPSTSSASNSSQRHSSQDHTHFASSSTKDHVQFTSSSSQDHSQFPSSSTRDHTQFSSSTTATSTTPSTSSKPSPSHSNFQTPPSSSTNPAPNPHSTIRRALQLHPISPLFPASGSSPPPLPPPLHSTKQRDSLPSFPPSSFYSPAHITDPTVYAKRWSEPLPLPPSDNRKVSELWPIFDEEVSKKSTRPPPPITRLEFDRRGVRSESIPSLFTYDLNHLPAPNSKKEHPYKVDWTDVWKPKWAVKSGRYSGKWGDLFGAVEEKEVKEVRRRSFVGSLRSIRRNSRRSGAAEVKEEMEDWVAVFVQD